jgi:hypothetical protein
MVINMGIQLTLNEEEWLKAKSIIEEIGLIRYTDSTEEDKFDCLRNLLEDLESLLRI